MSSPEPATLEPKETPREARRKRKQIRRVSGTMRAWRYEVALEQLKAQREALDYALFLLRQSLRERALTPEDGEHLRQLEIQLAQVADADQSVRKRTHARPTLLDRLVLRAWRWAVEGRFAVEYVKLTDQGEGPLVPR